MRRLLLSAAVLTLISGTAFAQPEEHERHVGKASVAPQVQDRAQAQLGVPPAPQRAAQGGGPTSFTNQVTGQPPGQGQGQPRGDRGGRDNRPAQQPAAQQPAAQPQVAAPQQQQNRDGNRGNWQGGRDNRAGYDNRGNDNRGGYDNRGNDNRGGYDNRRGDNRYDNRGPRRNYSNYNNYHRDWRPTQRYRAGAYRRPYGWYDRRWTFGEFLPSLFWARDYWLDYRTYDLPPPPYGATWVRVGNDALLIDEDSGEIMTVSYGVFY